jgi:putative ABC transport system substrate-binding protein
VALNAEVGPKRVELLHELLPTATSIALLINPTSPAISDPQSRDLQMAAGKLGLQLHVLHASTEREIETAFTTLVQAQASGLVIGPDVFFTTRSEQLAALALRHAVPIIYQYREFAAAGGLMSYGTNITDMFRLAGVYTGRILKGEKPADLPVQQATRVELIIDVGAHRAGIQSLIFAQMKEQPFDTGKRHRRPATTRSGHRARRRHDNQSSYGSGINGVVA